MYTLSREMLCRFGFLDNLFKNIGHDGELNIEYGKVQKMPKHRDTAAEEIEGFADTLFKFASPEDMLGEVDPSLNADWNDLFGEVEMECGGGTDDGTERCAYNSIINCILFHYII